MLHWNSMYSSELIGGNPDSVPNPSLFTNLGDTNVDSAWFPPQSSGELYH